MSVFDQFNANPYIRTYAGAPVNEALEVAKVMQQRHDKALADMQQHEYALGNIPGISDSDKAYKQKYAQELHSEFEKLKEAPEMAQQAINSLAAKYKQDPVLNQMATYATKKKEWEEQFKEDPSKYGDVASWEMLEATRRYEEAGGAAGGAVFNPPALYEYKDVNKFMLDNADAIKASSEGKFVYNEAKGSIETIDGEFVGFEEAQAVLNNALMADPEMRRQMQRQFKYMQNAGGFSGSFEDFINQTTQGTAEAASYSKVDRDAKGWKSGKSGSGGGNGEFGEWGVTVGGDAVAESFDQVSGYRDLFNSRTKRGNTAADNRATAAEDRAWKEAVAASDLDPRVAKYLTMTGIDGIQWRKPTASEVHGPAGQGGTGNATNWVSGAYSGSGGQKEVDKGAMIKYYKSQGNTDAQAQALADKTEKALNGVWGDNVVDNMNEVRRVAYQTRFTTPEAEFGEAAGGSKTIAAMNSHVRLMVNNMPTVTGSITGVDETGKFEMTQREMGETYEDYKTSGWDTAGSGQLQIQAKRRDGKGWDTITLTETQHLADFWKNLENIEVSRANNAKAGTATRSKHAARALSIAEPKLIQQVKSLDSQTNYTSTPIALDFGSLDPVIQNDFGQISLGKDANGDYIAYLNGANAFAKNKTMSESLKNAPSADAAMTELLQYFHRQYGAASAGQ